MPLGGFVFRIAPQDSLLAVSIFFLLTFSRHNET